jgi:hypothetical protein
VSRGGIEPSAPSRRRPLEQSLPPSDALANPNGRSIPSTDVSQCDHQAPLRRDWRPVTSRWLRSGGLHAVVGPGYRRHVTRRRPIESCEPLRPELHLANIRQRCAATAAERSVSDGCHLSDVRSSGRHPAGVQETVAYRRQFARQVWARLALSIHTTEALRHGTRTRPRCASRSRASPDPSQRILPYTGVSARGASSPRKGPCPPTAARTTRTFFQPDRADSRRVVKGDSHVPQPAGRATPSVTPER